MGKILRAIVAAAVGVFLGWLAWPFAVALSALALGDVEESGGAPGGGHDLAFRASLVVAMALAAGIGWRVAHQLRERRSLDKPVPPPWLSRWALFLLAGASAALLACWAARETGMARQPWFQDVATFAAWLVVWSSAVACFALAFAAGEAASAARASDGRRVMGMLAVAGCLSSLALPPVRALAEAELEPYDAMVEAARREPGPSVASATTFAAGFSGIAAAPGESSASCAESFLRPDGFRRPAWTMNERIARRRASSGVDVEQVLLDAVFATCRSARGNPAPYFTMAVKHGLLRGRRGPPDGETCDLDPELPDEPLDPILPIQARACWEGLQGEACRGGTVMVAILHLRAGGATYPEVAGALQMGESAVKMRWSRFVERLPREVRQQCR